MSVAAAAEGSEATTSSETASASATLATSTAKTRLTLAGTIVRETSDTSTSMAAAKTRMSVA